MGPIGPPIVDKKLYRRSKWGYFGELGEGDNARIRFIQTVISQEELNDITLIANIPGSEHWEVRDLFQRDVDDERVTNEIMPYYADPTKVKFFNPLTLFVLPMGDDSDVLKEIEYIEATTEAENGNEYEVYERKGYYRFLIHKESQMYARLEWNDLKCYIVAIDGQHRLSGLKRWQKKPVGASELSSWKIPVVILNIYKVDPDKDTANLLEIVRKTFVYINTQAVVVNRARSILLNDESINAICTQELIQHAHSNDSKPIQERDESIIPLIFFDWRGESQNHIRIHGPAAVKSIEEIHDWFQHYVLAEDGSPYQEIQLNLTDLVPPLDGFGEDKALSHTDSKRIREQFAKTVRPGFLHFLQNFTPYKKYIQECRDIEKEAIARSDLAQHAFMKLRFGTHNAPRDQRDAVSEEFAKLVDKFDNLKTRLFPEILARDIGMRGLVYALAICKEEYEEIINKSMSWLDYSEWVLEAIDGIFEEGWFESFSKLNTTQRRILIHLSFDESGSIINYKLKDVEGALGSLLVLLIFHYKFKKDQIAYENLEEIWNTYSLNLRKPIQRGFSKAIRAELKDTFPGPPSEFAKAVKKKAEKATNKKLNKLAKYIDIK